MSGWIDAWDGGRGSVPWVYIDSKEGWGRGRKGVEADRPV